MSCKLYEFTSQNNLTPRGGSINVFLCNGSIPGLSGS